MTFQFIYDSSKAARELDFTTRDINETILECIASMVDTGFVKAKYVT